MEYIIFLISMISLIGGANYVIVESERIALHFNISSFVIGATLIAVGTSLPEMAASMAASSMNKPEMAVANVLGSVTFNIALVLGVIFLFVKEIKPKRDLFKSDSAWSLFPLMIFFIMAYDGVIGKFEGFTFLILMAAYLLFLSKDAKMIEDEVDTDLVKEKFAWGKTTLFLLLGFVLVIAGANYTIESASIIARSLGVTEWVISLILIALGTSLPELVVSIVAAKKGNADMIIGNIIGSNVANFTIVLGSAAIVNPLTVDFSKYGFDILCMSSASFMLIFITANKLYNKSAGIALLLLISLMLHNSLKVLF
ncbi:calcium/sodium antiporter [Sulfurospirillum arcachonense]|uniref:calcium/sodium antiporter n=1 Tax=Sulfurospirillum arcachonense TaxID=57666 RepID=UPI0004699EF0|nr:calcium/sodium antiporter [Sulfurospirillum arcachonense]